eukprot:1041084-Pyramimonas_sp.AAC.1
MAKQDIEEAKAVAVGGHARAERVHSEARETTRIIQRGSGASQGEAAGGGAHQVWRNAVQDPQRARLKGDGHTSKTRRTASAPTSTPSAARAVATRATTTTSTDLTSRRPSEL